MVNEGGPSSSTIVQDVHISNTGVKDGSRGIHWDGDIQRLPVTIQ